jgi:xylulokinase/glycerol kinase
MKNIIALDLGTSSMRSILYNEEGNIVVSFGHEYHSVFPKPSHVEQDPYSWKEAAVDVLSKTAAYMKEYRLKAEGIAVTSQRSSLIPVDAGGEPLRYAIMWQDKRTIEQCERLKDEYGLENLYRLTGLRVNPYFVLPKIKWFQKNESELSAKTHKFLGVQDWVIFCLTGEYVTDYTQAGRTMLMNIEKFQWEEVLLRIAGIKTEKLPKLVPPGTVAGKITPGFAALTGLTAGLPVVVSGGDQQNAAVALGVTHAGMSEANTGTGSFILAHADSVKFDKASRVLVQASAIAGKWVIEAGIFSTGTIYRWFKEQFCPDLKNESDPYVKMDREAAESVPGSHGVLMIPHFEGSAAPFWNPMAKGVFFNLSLGTTRGDMIRSIQEGIALEIKGCLDLIQPVAGAIKAVNAAGGMIRSDLFCRIQAGFYNKPVVRYVNSEASSLGACMVASPALGIHGTLQDAVNVMTPEVDHIFLPVNEDKEAAEKLMQAKMKLYETLADGGVYEQFMCI